jgi:hypothetical protein
MRKETKMKVVLSTNNEKQEHRKKLAEFLENKLNKKRGELMEKKYVISGGLDTARALHNFLKNEAQWKFNEALGIIEGCRVLNEEIFKLTSATSDHELELGPVTIEALYYFLTKEEGKGLEKAESFINNLLRPINEALTAYKTEWTEVNQMERDLGTLQDAIMNRISFEGEDEFLKEIEQELSEEIKNNQ